MGTNQRTTGHVSEMLLIKYSTQISITNVKGFVNNTGPFLYFCAAAAASSLSHIHATFGNYFGSHGAGFYIEFWVFIKEKL